jgi:hypothetical protein
LPTIKSVRVGPRTYKGNARFRQVHPSESKCRRGGRRAYIAAA